MIKKSLSSFWNDFFLLRKLNIGSDHESTESTESATVLCRLAEQFKSDKCPAILHTYTPKYHLLLEPFREDLHSVLEIGVGNPQLMKPIAGHDYKPGASLRMWEQYFPHAQIIGFDIEPSVQFAEGRIKTFIVDQSSPSSLLSGLSDAGLRNVDLIIDDGSHLIEHQLISLETLWPKLSVGGIYIIEDIREKDLEHFTTPKVSTVSQILKHSWIHIHYSKHNSAWDSFVAYKKLV